MMSPCGIEIEVGQVWRAVGLPKSNFRIDGFGEYRGDLAVYGVSLQSGEWTYPHGWVRLSEFTSKKGGYRIVKEVNDADR